MATIEYGPVITDIDEDGNAAFTFEAWTDGHALGFKVTRASDGKISFVYLNPSTDTWNRDDYSEGFNPDVFVYTGPAGDPASDMPHNFYNIEFGEVQS